MILHWEFSPTAGGDEDGFSDAFIETFTGDAERFLAREAIQNSIDANNERLVGPVIVEFNKVSINKLDFPGYETIKNVFKYCLDYWPKDQKVQSFFSNALKMLEKRKN